MQVPLGVQLFNENKLEDMSKILANLHKLVPTREKTGKLTLPNGGTLEFDDTTFFQILLGGDQLTVARARGTQALRASHETARDRLEGIIPVCEDWHSRMTFLRVSINITKNSIIIPPVLSHIGE
jgi:L1 cell adhesion molecule like protein